MPAVCVHCHEPCQNLFTLFGSLKQNYALKECQHCSELADPYVELDFTIILIDLFLLKKSVYRHLLFNADQEESMMPKQQRHLLPTSLRLGLAVVLLDACKMIPK